MGWNIPGNGSVVCNKGLVCKFIKMVDNLKVYGKMVSGKSGYDSYILLF